jgi:respiratory nitrite reductase specific cytochrome c biogenesis protein NrfK/respiratory nitrite reductase specific cytochrome c biogenesis protein NrfL
VNKPFEVEGWKIYQYGYDTQMGAQSQISILELVSDPWLPLAYAGIYMLLAGVVLLVVYTRWNMKRLLPIGALLVVALAIVSYLIPIVRSTTLVPALQSPWFFPHILILYRVLLADGRRCRHSHLRTHQATSYFIHHPSDLFPRLRRLDIHDLRHDVWCLLGKGGLGATTGRGIPRRHGQPSPGSPISSTSIIVSSLAITSGWLSG